MFRGVLTAEPEHMGGVYNRVRFRSTLTRIVKKSVKSNTETINSNQYRNKFVIQPIKTRVKTTKIQ